MASFLYRLGHLSVRRRRWVVLIWVGLLVGVGAASTAAGGTTNDSISLPGTESQDAIDLLDERFPAQGGSSTQVVLAAPDDALLSDARLDAVIAEAIAEVAEIAGVALATPPAATGAISRDGTIGLAQVRYPVSALEVEETTPEAIVEALQPAHNAGITVAFGGEVVPGVEMEPPSSELLGLGVAVLVLLATLGSVLAMGLPLVTALLGLGVGISGIGLMSAFVDLSSSAPPLAVMIGLAVGIDYAPFRLPPPRQNPAPCPPREGT